MLVVLQQLRMAYNHEVHHVRCQLSCCRGRLLMLVYTHCVTASAPVLNKTTAAAHMLRCMGL
jgi:hypothetical protein